MTHATDTASGTYRLGTTAVEFDAAPGATAASSEPPGATTPPAFNAAMPVCADWQHLGNLLILEVHAPQSGLVQEAWAGHIWNRHP